MTCRFFIGRVVDHASQQVRGIGVQVPGERRICAIHKHLRHMTRAAVDGATSPCSAYPRCHHAKIVLDWPSLLVGALVGGAVGIVFQNMMFPPAERRWKAYRRRNFYIEANRAWSRIEALHPRLVLVQAGWGEDGCFPEGSVILHLVRPFALNDAATRAFRDTHHDEWAAAGFTNGEQVGIAAISNTRISDDPSSEIAGQAHLLTLSVHRYRFFEFLATHILRLAGTEEERAVLDRLAGTPRAEQPVQGFPTPCSVGLSVLCEEGTRLVLTRRSTALGAGGYWEAGSIF